LRKSPSYMKTIGNKPIDNVSHILSTTNVVWVLMWFYISLTSPKLQVCLPTLSPEIQHTTTTNLKQINIFYL
jgi:hypothetical protein